MRERASQSLIVRDSLKATEHTDFLELGVPARPRGRPRVERDRANKVVHGDGEEDAKGHVDKGIAGRACVRGKEGVSSPIHSRSVTQKKMQRTSGKAGQPGLGDPEHAGGDDGRKVRRLGKGIVGPVVVKDRPGNDLQMRK